MKGRMKVNSNAMRSGVVVLGALAFGYLTLQLGFRPFLERAQSAVDDFDPASSSSSAAAEQQQPDSSSSTRHF
ncbi:hypothetical protein D8674_009833 [Pyrus ussuriensis x Pyrus communis]|uniref:Uncharacterized protein n=1 Tax=Pyrus ussuriensis x Pyrus communis TaxID=2448454 RepID=A0A5N5FEB4_9ROSA|nr:hypothetical protein D8674_009833 [Pyrus ussuriensis x Pyrus communis]